MNRRIVGVIFALLLAFALPTEHAAAHGDHIWFVLPEENAIVSGVLTFEVQAPYARNQHIHLSITKADGTVPIWQDLVERGADKYSTTVDTSTWGEGVYSAEVVLLGALFQHPMKRRFTVNQH
ncbi:MAG: hypothetical protein P8O79_10600 [Halieaceae bacterium]|nr:hypothetical protein [Halieaceae bacterium]